MRSIDHYVKRAEAIWMDRTGQPAHADYLRLEAYGDQNAKVVIQHTAPKRGIARAQGRIVFDPQSDEILQDFSPEPIRNSLSWLEGAHYMMFEHLPLRWLYFLGGLSGAAMIATGILFWMRARIRGHQELISVRVIRALGAGTITGLIAASVSFLVANRALPDQAAFHGIGRAGLEILVFYSVWITAFLHAAMRDKSAWAEQTAIIGVIGVIAVGLNWISTGDHLGISIAQGAWSVAGVDLVLLVGSILAFIATKRLHQTPSETIRRTDKFSRKTR